MCSLYIGFPDPDNINRNTNINFPSIRHEWDIDNTYMYVLAIFKNGYHSLSLAKSG